MRGLIDPFRRVLHGSAIMEAQMHALMTVRDAAARLAIAERTARHWIATGRLPVVRLARRCVRVPAEAVERIAQGQPADEQRSA